MQVESKCSEEAKFVFVWFFSVLIVSKAFDCVVLEEIQAEPHACNPLVYLSVELQILASLIV